MSHGFSIFIIYLIIIAEINEISFGLKYSSYQHSMECFPKEPTHFPKTIKEVQDLVQRAKHQNLRVKALGSLHSLVDLICTDGIPISMENFNKVRINEDHTVTAGAGATIYEIATKLNEYNLALINLPLYSGITIGGATGCGSHGGTLKHPSTISEQILSMKIVDGTGSIRNISDEEELRAFRVHLGLLGVVVEVKLRTVAQFKIKMSYYLEESEDELFLNMVNIAKTSDVSEFFWSPTLKSGAVWNGTHVPMKTIGTDKLTLLPRSFIPKKLILKYSGELFQATKNSLALAGLEVWTFKANVIPTVFLPPPFAKQDGQTPTTNPAIGISYEMFASFCAKDTSFFNISSCGWEGKEYLGIYTLNPSVAIGVERLPEFFKLAKKILNKFPAAFPIGGFLFRFARKSNSFMAVENAGDVVHVEFLPIRRIDAYNDPIYGLNAYQALVQLMIIKLKGRPHWGKSGPVHHNYKNMINNGLGKDLTAFKKIADKYDPHCVFCNDFKMRIFGQEQKVTINNNIKHCALEDFCICSSDHDCANFQKCEFYDNSKVCSD